VDFFSTPLELDRASVPGIRYGVPQLQILSIAGARWSSLFRLLGLLGLLAYPFQGDLRTPTDRSSLQLQDGMTVEGQIDERFVGGALWGYQITGVSFEDGKAPAQLKTISPHHYIVAAVDVKSVEPVYEYRVKALIASPFRFLLIFNLIWLLHLPALLLWPVYELVGAMATLINMIHALIVEQNHTELGRFIVRVHQYRWKLLLSLSTDQLPHVDIHGRERGKLPMRFTATIDGPFSRMQVLARLTLPVLLYAFF
jgi:hypothetical protein